MTQRVRKTPNIDDEHKWELLQEICISDSKNPKIIRMSELLWELSQSQPLRFFKLALAIARDGIEYESDIKQFGHEDIAGVTRAPNPNDAIDAYTRGHDDCDAKARLFVALCLAAGFTARLWPLWKHGVLQHVAAEVHYGSDWLHAETILARANLGETHTDVPKESNGHWKMS
jgi:transglutaminase-like putative cysteine protease